MTGREMRRWLALPPLPTGEAYKKYQKAVALRFFDTHPGQYHTEEDWEQCEEDYIESLTDAERSELEQAGII